MTEWAFWGCAPFLAAAFITDVRTMRIPNWITASALLTGFLVQGAVNGWQGLVFAGCGTAAGFILLILMYFIGAVGAGDVKLFAGIGAWTGMLFTAQIIVYSILFAAFIGWLIVLRKREAGSRLRQAASRIAGFMLLRNLSLIKGRDQELLRFPFMLAVVPGSICAYFYF